MSMDEIHTTGQLWVKWFAERKTLANMVNAEIIISTAPTSCSCSFSVNWLITVHGTTNTKNNHPPNKKSANTNLPAGSMNDYEWLSVRRFIEKGQSSNKFKGMWVFWKQEKSELNKWSLSHILMDPGQNYRWSGSDWKHWECDVQKTPSISKVQLLIEAVRGCVYIV